MKEEIFEGLREAVRNFDIELAEKLANKAIVEGIDPVEALEEGLAKALKEVGDRFGRGDAFITELIASAKKSGAGACAVIWGSNS